LGKQQVTFCRTSEDSEIQAAGQRTENVLWRRNFAGVKERRFLFAVFSAVCKPPLLGYFAASIRHDGGERFSTE
jgi:hypothetical protein